MFHDDYYHEIETIIESPEPDVSMYDLHCDVTYESKFLKCFDVQHDVDMMSCGSHEEVRKRGGLNVSDDGLFGLSIRFFCYVKSWSLWVVELFFFCAFLNPFTVIDNCSLVFDLRVICLLLRSAWNR